jgi:hypothetical protein
MNRLLQSRQNPAGGYAGRRFLLNVNRAEKRN